MKPFTVSLALDTDRVTPDTVFQTARGAMTIGTATIHDAHKQGSLTVAQSDSKSSNIGTAKMALQMPAQRDVGNVHVARYYGQQPKVGFPGAVAGRMRNYKTRRPIGQATMSYGHGLSVSLIPDRPRLHDLCTSVATRFLYDLHAIKMRNSNGDTCVSEKTAMQMREMLETVTLRGTAPGSDPGLQNSR